MSHAILPANPLNRPKSILQKSKAVFLLIGLVSFSQDPELNNVMITGARAAHDLHLPKELLLVFKYEVAQSTCPCSFLSCLYEEVTTNALQKPPGLLVPCYVVLPADNRWLKFSPLRIQGM